MHLLCHALLVLTHRAWRCECTWFLWTIWGSEMNLKEWWISAWFIHPSFQSSKGTFWQGVCIWEKNVLPKILQYNFPDTAQFVRPLLDPSTLITTPMETYAELALLLFTPFRTLDDLQDCSSSSTKKLREVYCTGGFNQGAIQFLQNVQDVKTNCFRAGQPEDLLQKTTEPSMPADSIWSPEKYRWWWWWWWWWWKWWQPRLRRGRTWFPFRAAGGGHWWWWRKWKKWLCSSWVFELGSNAPKRKSWC